DIIGLTFEISNDDEEDIENEKYKECLKLFKDVKEENVRKYQNHYYCDKLINNEKLEGEYAFIYWLIENQNSKKDFIQILNDYIKKLQDCQNIAEILKEIVPEFNHNKDGN
ncbi:hypothetical protein PN884_001609, partial [Campylobacter coli]|nr:hypothetical protein [Campylobacter coli]